MTTYKMKLVDGYPGFSSEQHYILNRLRSRFNVVISDDPDYLIYSVVGVEHSNPKYDRCVKIFYTDENVRPDYGHCDYSLTFDYLDDPRNLRLPLYIRIMWPGQLAKPPSYDAASVLASKSRFCNFVYSNSCAKTRIDFFKKLSQYKQVDSGGLVLNNIGHRADDKMSFLRPYKFTIAFENASYPGYTTEKVVEPMLANSLPIYWGNPLINREFNARSFINCHDYSSFDDVIEEVVRLDTHDDLYVSRLQQPWLLDNKESVCCRDDYLTSFFEKVFATQPHSYPKWAGVIPRDLSVYRFD